MKLAAEGRKGVQLGMIVAPHNYRVNNEAPIVCGACRLPFSHSCSPSLSPRLFTAGSSIHHPSTLLDPQVSLG